MFKGVLVMFSATKGRAEARRWNLLGGGAVMGARRSIKWALAAATVLGVAGGLSPNANATLLPFGVNPSTLGGSNTTYTADAMDFSSVSKVTQTNSTTQNEIGYAQLSQMTFNGNPALSFGPGSNQAIYLTFTGTVNASSFTSSGPITSFNYSMYGDIGLNDTYHNSITDSNLGQVTGTTGDTLLATGSLYGSGAHAGFNSNGGPIFSLLATFNLTAAGQNVFVNPNPFYEFNFSASTTSQPGNATLISGSTPPAVRVTSVINSSFAVPEPGSLAILGVGLIGLAGMTNRRRKSAQQR